MDGYLYLILISKNTCVIRNIEYVFILNAEPQQLVKIHEYF